MTDESRSDRPTCEYCGKPIATYEDGEMLVSDPRVANFCWAVLDDGDVCEDAPKGRDVAKEQRARGDYLRDQAKDGGLR